MPLHSCCVTKGQSPVGNCPLRHGLIARLHNLVIFTFSSSFRFFLTTNTWFLVMLSLTDFLLNASFGTATFKSTQSTI